MISAGEASGELYGSMLSREVKKIWPDTQIFGIGGSRMKEEGVSLIAPVSHVIGIVEAIKHFREVRKTFKKAADALIYQKPDILVLIDFPDFNVALAKKAKSAGIPILYYVSPQVWAWRTGRVKKIASLVNKIAVLFPFEADYYKKTGLPCEFVGHPITEIINIQQTKEELKNQLGLNPNKTVITLLPGSRPNEIKRHQAIVKEVANIIHTEFPQVQIVVPLVSGTNLTDNLPDYIKVIYDRTTEAIACSEAAAVASGTATLQTSLLGTPMVVFYRISPLTFHLLKPMVKVKFISLVNLLSGKEVVLELLQKDANPYRIFSELKKILNDHSYRNAMISNLKKIRDIMAGKRPSARVANMVGEIAGWENASII
jgi:lipid-A-disaccharide synthase